MIKVTKIRMKQYSTNSMKLEEIKDLKLEGNLDNPGWFSKESIHDYIKNNNGVVNVNIYPYPKLVAVTTATDRYVKSTPNRYGFDNLLELPRE